jgi:hypothetical protein
MLGRGLAEVGAGLAGIVGAGARTAGGLAGIGARAIGPKRTAGLFTAAAGYGMYRGVTSDFISGSFYGIHGTGEDAQARLGALRGLGAATGIGAGIYGGFLGLAGRGLPIATPLRKTVTGVYRGAKGLISGVTATPRAVIAHPGMFARGFGSTRRIRTERVRRRQPKPFGPQIPMFARVNPKLQAFRAGRRTGNIMNAVVDYPSVAAMSAGIGAGIFEGIAANTPRYAGNEGNIIGIRSAPSGGISPELQFSTQGLVFALHNNNKRVF